MNFQSKKHGLLATALFVLTIGCAGRELVMVPGMNVSATNANGKITISAIGELTRSYVWDENSIEVRLLKRDKRWYGSYGAYSPGGGEVIHAVLEEGQQHFCSEQEALEWLMWQNDLFQYAYTNDGLVVGFNSIFYQEKRFTALHVCIWQFYINGQRPVSIKGSEDGNFIISYSQGDQPDRQPPGNFKPNFPAIINGRLYSGIAIDYMKERGVNPDAIEKVIRLGTKKEYKHYIAYYGVGRQFDPFKDLMWVRLDYKGRVILFG